MDIKPADLLFVWGHDWLERTIENVTHGPSHVAMFVNENTVCEAQGGRPVGEQDLSFYLDSGSRLEVWGDPRLTDERRAGMVAYAKTLYGVRYDYVLIPLEWLHFKFGLSLDWYHNKDHLICAGYIDEIATSEAVIWTDKPNPAPVDLLNYGKLQKKYRLIQTDGGGCEWTESA